jgi:hypothetical protein
MCPHSGLGNAKCHGNFRVSATLYEQLQNLALPRPGMKRPRSQQFYLRLSPRVNSRASQPYEPSLAFVKRR